MVVSVGKMEVGGALRGVNLIEKEGGSGVENDVLGRVGKMEVGGAVRSGNSIEKESGSGFENDVLGQGAESLVVVSESKLVVGVVEEGMELSDSVYAGARSLEVDD